MIYEAELHFLQAAFEKCHLQTLLINPLEPLDERVDMGLRALLEREEVRNNTLYDVISSIQPGTIYKITDLFLCCYMFLLLPDTEPQTVLLIGPYRSVDLTEHQLLELAEQFGIAPRQIQHLKNYYNGMPVLLEDNPLFAMLDVFGEHIWGGSDKFTVVNINQEHFGAVSPLSAEKMSADPEQTVWNMQAMERRYAHENELMQAIAQGQMHKAERLLAFFSKMSLEQRLTDTVRNVKNYCIIMNTLLRKAAESGGVHPVYLDSVSSDFARKIELLKSASDASAFMNEMIRSYCRLVRKHSIHQYSPPVQKAITYIDSDLTSDLSLSALAAMQNVSAGYLSSLFRQETGQTLTEHVNQKRIKHAMQLLKTTKLQVQTVAQHCGIVDVHYFSKLFKKHVGMTPKEYRESL